MRPKMASSEQLSAAGKKRRRKGTPMEAFGAVPKGFPLWELERFMIRVGRATVRPERLKELLIEGVELFGPVFMLYFELAHNFARGQDDARKEAIAEAIDDHHRDTVSAVLELDIAQDHAKLVAYLAPPVFPRTPMHVYLVRTTEGLCKIGITQDMDTRINALKTVVPYGIETLHSLFHKDAKEIERDLHKRFADKRVNGEWFRLDEADIACIRAMGDQVE